MSFSNEPKEETLTNIYECFMLTSVLLTIMFSLYIQFVGNKAVILSRIIPTIWTQAKKKKRKETQGKKKIINPQHTSVC